MRRGGVEADNHGAGFKEGDNLGRYLADDRIGKSENRDIGLRKGVALRGYGKTAGR